MLSAQKSYLMCAAVEAQIEGYQLFKFNLQYQGFDLWSYGFGCASISGLVVILVGYCQTN